MSITSAPLSGVTIEALSAPEMLCITCLANPRHAGGRLSRCLSCIRASAELDRQDRIAAEALVAARRTEFTKTCTCCHKVKALADFSPHRTARDGRRKVCKKCVSSGVIKARIQKPRERTPEQLARNLESVLRWQVLNPEKHAAHKAVTRAVKTGKLVPPPTCQALGCRKRKLQAHHGSYSARNQLKVSWLCKDHHGAVHKGVNLKLKASASLKVARAPKG